MKQTHFTILFNQKLSSNLFHKKKLSKVNKLGSWS